MSTTRLGPATSCEVLVVGAGIAGLTVAYTVAAARPDVSVALLEATGRAGGQIMTTTTEGYTFEHGASTLTMHQPEMVQLAQRLGLSERVRPAVETAMRNYLYVGGTLQAVPRSAVEVATSSLLSWRGKLRLLAEPLVGRWGAVDDETVYEFAARRFGDELARVIVLTALQGITAGDARTTSFRAAAPRLCELDRTVNRTGLLGLALRAQRAARKLPSATLRCPVTFRDGGLQVLPDKLASALGTRVRYWSPVHELRAGEAGGYMAALASGELVAANHIVLALPAFQASSVLRSMAPEAAKLLGTIPYAGLRVVGLGYPRAAFPQAPDGFGFLASPSDGLRVIGAVLSSNLFPEQAPADRLLVRLFAGGVFTPEVIDEPDGAALELAAHVVRKVYGVRGDPELVRHVTWRQGLPQYTRERPRTIQRLHRALAAFPGIHLTGNSYNGVGVDSTIRDATGVAGAVLRALGPEPLARPNRTEIGVVI